MVRYSSRRKTVRPFRAMKKARSYRSKGLAYFGRTLGRYAYNRVSNQIHNFRKMISLPPINSTGADRHLGYQFNLDQLSDEGDFQNMYDSYKILKIILHLEPVYDSTNAQGVAPVQRWMRIVHDYDDVTPLTSEDQYLEYGGCKSKPVTSKRSINIPLYPKIQQYTQSSGGGGTAVFRAIKAGWIPTAHDQVEHLGLKIFVPNVSLPVDFQMFNVRATFIMQFKNTK